MTRKQHPEAGFAWTDLLVVILILGMLAAIAIPIYIAVDQQHQQDKTMQADVRATKQNLKVALGQDKSIHSGTTFEQVGAPVQNSQIPKEKISVLVQSEHEILILGQIKGNPHGVTETLQH